MTPINALQKLFEARDTIHFLHLNTTSYEVHKTLNKFYKEWIDLSDSFIETYQGKYGRISGSITIEANTNINVLSYLSELMIFLNRELPALLDDFDSDLENIIADMKGLVNHTFYFLTLK